jgi:hypothetical protein
VEGLCTSLPFFFLEIEQEGEGNGRRGGGQAMSTGMLGDKARAARVRGRDGDGPAQQRAARRLGVHGQQARSGTASGSSHSGRGVTRAA